MLVDVDNEINVLSVGYPAVKYLRDDHTVMEQFITGKRWRFVDVALFEEPSGEKQKPRDRLLQRQVVYKCNGLHKF